MSRRLYGMIPSHPSVLARATPYITLPPALVPAHFNPIPPSLNMFGNDSFGDCVSAEEAFKLAVFSVACGLPEVCPTYDEVVAFARQYGYLNGANLTDVMDTMASSGMLVGGKIYKDGPYTSVDWTNWANLTSAISQGPVKIGVAGDPLQGVVGSGNGWWGIGLKGWIQNHCVELSGYGTAAELAADFNVPIQAGVDPSTQCCVLDTWGTQGIVDFAGTVQGLTSEAWLRIPSTVGEGPINPTPPPTPTPPAPTPTPVPPVPPPTPTPAPPVPVAGTYQVTGTLTLAAPAGGWR